MGRCYQVSEETYDKLSEMLTIFENRLDTSRDDTPPMDDFDWLDQFYWFLCHLQSEMNK